MLRPATPLSLLFFVAFVLLLLSTLSTPVIKGIPLASFKGTDFGVWGYCGPSNCSKIEIGYDTASLATPSGDFSLSSTTRHSVSYILIVHPIAALLALICFSLAVASHFHSPAHSPRFLLGLFILTIPTLLASLLAFLVDILLFIPHVGWGGWVVLAATIIVILASLVTCGMRRTLVSRKARRKRIAENAELGGENYFNKREVIQPDIIAASFPRAESPPPLTGGSISPHPDKTAGFGTSFDLKPGYSPDDQTPLNPSNNGSIRGLGSDPGRSTPSRHPPPRDQYGNFLPPDAPGLRRPRSNGSMGSDRSNRQQFYGRGGRGYGPGPSGPPGRGGYPPRGGPMMRGGPARGPPGPGYGNNRGRGMMIPPGGMMMGRGGPLPPPGYQQDRNFARPQGSRDQSPAPFAQPLRAMSPARMGGDPSAIGQAVELDERNGLPSPTRTGGYDIPDQYMQPPRGPWNQKPATPPLLGSRNLSPIQASPVEMYANSPPRAHVRRPSAADAYYEDIDPRFADPSPASIPLASSSNGAFPHSVQTGTPRSQPMSDSNYLSPTYNHVGSSPGHDLRDLRDPSVESLQEGQRSPASDISHFTSVSQRGVNPNWRPPPGGGQQRNRGPPPAPRSDDVVLNSNPEFALPGVGPPTRGIGPREGGGSGFRGRGGSGMGLVPMRGAPMMGGFGSPGGGGGRYPSS